MSSFSLKFPRGHASKMHPFVFFIAADNKDCHLKIPGGKVSHLLLCLGEEHHLFCYRLLNFQVLVHHKIIRNYLITWPLLCIIKPSDDLFHSCTAHLWPSRCVAPWPRSLDKVRSWKSSISIQTRPTYNCAHLRSTKESLTYKYFDTGRYWLVLGQYRTVRVDIW